MADTLGTQNVRKLYWERDGRPRAEWRRHARDRARAFADRAANWTERAERTPILEDAEKYVRLAVACAATSQAFTASAKR